MRSAIFCLAEYARMLELCRNSSRYRQTFFSPSDMALSHISPYYPELQRERIIKRMDGKTGEVRDGRKGMEEW